jgi:hypothetical protein
MTDIDQANIHVSKIQMGSFQLCTNINLKVSETQVIELSNQSEQRIVLLVMLGCFETLLHLASSDLPHLVHCKYKERVYKEVKSI